MKNDSTSRTGNRDSKTSTQMSGGQYSRQGSGSRGAGSSVGRPDQTHGQSAGIEKHSHAGNTGFGSGQISPQTHDEPSVGNGTRRPSKKSGQR